MDAIGHVVVRTTTDTATGDRGVYLPPTGLARLGGDVHIIRGPNELTGNDAIVNMKTGVATLLAAPGGQVAGTIVPNINPARPGRGAGRARNERLSGSSKAKAGCSPPGLASSIKSAPWCAMSRSR